ncbi:MAG TPA: hypothetical protein VHC22_03235 [Pirellulales bacterium]|nr:hypothetical protein [Pirellulales bacterium]
MPRQLSLKSLLWLMVVVGVGCVTLPRPIEAVKRWLWPQTSWVCGELDGGRFFVTPHIVITDEEEALRGVPETPWVVLPRRTSDPGRSALLSQHCRRWNRRRWHRRL